MSWLPAKDRQMDSDINSHQQPTMMVLFCRPLLLVCIALVHSRVLAFSLGVSRAPSGTRQRTRLSSFSAYFGEEDEELTSVHSTSLDYAMHPMEVRAVKISERLGLSESQHGKLAELSSCVVAWNEKINLVSRKDCSQDVVFGRHILPSLALIPSLTEDQSEKTRVMDVGTGGGFPGLPLAIAFPEIDFLLVDSVGKKLDAVQAIAEELGLKNVQTHHGRVEQMADDELEGSKHRHKYDCIVGRSVTALPRFCFWVSDLLKRDTGRLLYIIGGELEDKVLSKLSLDVEIEELLEADGCSDKRLLAMDQPSVQLLAKESGEVKRKIGRTKKRNNRRRKNKDAKGAWSKRDATVPKQRGYENFKRYGY